MRDLPTPIFIAHANALARLAEELARERIIAVDTEANGMYAYQEQVCLIQFSTPSKDYVVDPLSLNDLSPLRAIFADESIEKVFHASEYDLIMLHQDFGFRVRGLFDTMIAARILGWPKTGLGPILETHFGVRVDKKYQRANWGRRPILANMLAYAQVDTHYLIPLRQKMKAELEATGRWEIAVEDFRRASRVDSSHHRNGVAAVWRVRGAYDLTPRQAAILQELCRFRDSKARALDRPLFKVISDKALLKISQAAPRSLQEMERLPGVSSHHVKWLGEGLLRAVQRGRRAAPIYPPRTRRREEDYHARLDCLRQWRRRKAQAINVPSDVVLPKDLLYALAEANPKQAAELHHLLATVPWRREKFGEEILRVLAASE